MVSDISEKILDIIAEHPTAKSLILHTGACDVVKQQSEVLKQDFTNLLNKVRSLDTVVFVSAPLPTVRRGDERLSRLLVLNRWLKATCAAQSVNFIDNFNIFWQCRHLFKADGSWLGTNMFGVLTLTDMCQVQAMKLISLLFSSEKTRAPWSSGSLINSCAYR